MKENKLKVERASACQQIISTTVIFFIISTVIVSEWECDVSEYKFKYSIGCRLQDILFSLTVHSS